MCCDIRVGRHAARSRAAVFQLVGMAIHLRQASTGRTRSPSSLRTLLRSYSREEDAWLRTGVLYEVAVFSSASRKAPGRDHGSMDREVNKFAGRAARFGEDRQRSTASAVRFDQKRF